MVEAVAMRTHGLGGDSEVSLVEAGSGASIGLGPRRVVPVCLLAGQHGELVHAALDRQARLDQAGDMHGRFVVPMRAASRLPAGLTKAQAAILEELGTDPVPLDTIARSSITKAALIRLAALGHVMFAALTPTDAAHVLGLHAEFDAKAARKAAELFARRSDARGERIAADGGAVSQLIVETLVRRSAEAILDAALAQDGFLEPALSRTTLAQAALTRHSRSVAVQMALTIPLVGVGASAATYYPAIAARLGAECVVPRHAEVANAIGTVVGHIEMSAEVTISQGEDGTFLVQGLKAPERATSLPEAFELAENAARAEAAAKARAAGADEIEIRVHREENTAVIDGRPFFLEAVLRATATGRPRIKSL
jgi:N-methylhydantoinase A/oxoprolinase/acetone carboxylase beta subunit